MKVEVNGKLFVCRYNDRQELVISLDGVIDVQFFKEWEDSKTHIKIKKDCVKDIPIFKVNETGVLRNCLPILNLNEDEVKIIYDFYSDRVFVHAGDLQV